MNVSVYPPMDTRAGPGITDFTISPIGGRAPTRFSGINPRMSWLVSGIGSFSADVPTSDLLDYLGDGVSLKKLRGKWLGFEHEFAGMWGGILVDVQPRPDGITEIAGRSWGELLAKRRTAKQNRVISGPPGAVVLRVLTDIGREDFVWLTGMEADEFGESITLQLRGESALDVVRSLSQRTDQEWTVSQERVFQWRYRVGADRTETVQLVEGVHLVEITPTWSLDPIVNDLYATPADSRYELTRGFTFENDDSIAEHGRRQDRVAFAGGVTRSTLAPMAKTMLARMVRRGESISATVANVDDCWAEFREGDTVRVVMPSINDAFNLRVMVRSLEPDAGLMRISGMTE